MRRQNIGERYIQYVKRHFRAGTDERDYFFDALEDSVTCYIEENPQATYHDLRVHFGSASEIPQCKLNRPNPKVCIVSLAVVFFLVLGTTSGYQEYMSAYEIRNGYFLQQEFNTNEAPETVNKNEPMPIKTLTKTVQQETLDSDMFNSTLLSNTKEHTLSYYDSNGKLCFKMSLVSSFKAQNEWGYVAHCCTPTLYIYDKGWTVTENESSLSDGTTTFNVTMKKDDLELYGCTTIYCNKYGAVNANCYSGRVRK